LPRSLRQAVQQIRFPNLCFAKTLCIQPLEHLACATYNADWLSSDGKTIRPVPGMEAEYGETVAGLPDLLRENKMAPDVVIEPPRSGREKKWRLLAQRDMAWYPGGVRFRSAGSRSAPWVARASRNFPTLKGSHTTPVGALGHPFGVRQRIGHRLPRVRCATLRWRVQRLQR
jgi:hypothetical protein